MKYFAVKEGSAASVPDCWQYFSISDSFDLNDARDEAVCMFEEDNNWVFDLDCRRTQTKDLTEREYFLGLQFNIFYENKYKMNNLRKKYNLYPSIELAKEFADPLHKTGYVRIGYPGMHNVYKINQDGNYIFVYHYDAERLGELTL